MSLALLVTGAGGRLGTALLHAVRARPDTFARGLRSAELDVRDPAAVERVLQEWARVLRADSRGHRLVVVNTAGYTDVDRAESDAADAYAVNAAGPALLARTCARIGAELVHLSTDYVFAGDADRPYEVDDEPRPQSVYGRTKLDGEHAVRLLLPAAGRVVRTAWLWSGTGHDFVATIARLEGERETLSVVDDQTGSPTWVVDLAAGLCDLAASDAPPGTYHAVNAGATTRHQLARAVFEELGADPDRVLPTTSQVLGRPAPRPAWSVLSCASWQAAGLPPLRDWRTALAAGLRACAAPAQD